jgi:methyl-accepting chemotaxis protein
MTAKGFRFWQTRLAADVIPILGGVLVAVTYFLSVMPGARQYLGKYLLTALFLFLITRVPNEWYFRTRLLPPIKRYKRGKKEGRIFSRTELAVFYDEFVAHVPRSQMLAIIVWSGSVVLFAVIQYFWIQASWESVVAVLFTGVISASLAVSFTYFLTKRITAPLIEEVAAQLDILPDVSKWRVSFFLKAGVSVMLMTALAFTAYGVLVHARLTRSLDEYALLAGSDSAKTTALQLSQTDPMHWKGLLAGEANPLFTLVVLDGAGTAQEGLSSGPFEKAVLQNIVKPGQKIESGSHVLGLRNEIALYPINQDRILALMSNPQSAGELMKKMIFSGLLFLVLTVAVMGIYVLWLNKDTARTLARAVEYNQRLAVGDLTRTPAIWCDDEIGVLLDNLRIAFQGLQRMTREVATASTSVDEEVNRTGGVTESIHREVTTLTSSSDGTTGSLKTMEEGMQRVSQAMEQVATATQEVSSTILELQASVEEIARNSDVLIQSVEKTASSSSEISASTAAVKTSTERLYQSGQEAVSFFAELDASLEETRRNAKALSDTSSRVTQDAEAGFSAVAAVEDEILRTSHATEESRNTLNELVAAIDRIGRAVDLIQDVTEQTNLLSLNASIIAAGAGEHGKSFAVVATQIRELSSRTAGNAKEIRGIIRSLTSSGQEMASSMDNTFQVVHRSTELSRAAGDALRTILESAAGQEEMSKRIAAATEELAHGGQSANRAMHGIFEMMEGITGATRDQAASTRYLNEETERVRDVALQLRNATEEQAKGTRVISEAITQIMEDSRQATQAVHLQTKEASSIHEGMRQVSATAQSIERAFADLARASDHLRTSASALRREIQTFKTA